MMGHAMKTKLSTLLMAFLGLTAVISPAVFAQSRGELPKPIILTEPKEPLEDRLQRKIALDVRDMNIVDVIKFLAEKGEFNVVISPTVTGRTTVLLNNVAIKDAMDIVIISNGLAYKAENNIIQVMSSAEFEAIYGRQFSDKTEVAIVHLQYAKPSYVLAALDNIKSNVGKIIIDEDTGSVVLIDTPASIDRMKEAIKDIEKPLETVIYSLQYAKADVVADKLRARIDAKAVGSIVPDERSNQLIVRVFPGRRDEVEKIIYQLDSPTKEVLIKARILQVILKPNYDVGIDWGVAIAEKNFGDITVDSAFGTTEVASAGKFGQIAFGNVDLDNFELSVRALDQVSDTKIVANPQILATNYEEAKIHIGDTVPYIISTVAGTGDNAITSEDVRFIDVGLKLNVTPIINDDGMVTMHLRPELSSVVGFIQSTNEDNPTGIPQVNKTQVETTVMVKDGTTVILAGLRKDDKAHVKKGVPVLMDIPYIEKLFSRTNDSITSSEIVIFITPQIVSGTENLQEIRGTIKPSKSY